MGVTCHVVRPCAHVTGVVVARLRPIFSPSGACLRRSLASLTHMRASRSRPTRTLQAGPRRVEPHRAAFFECRALDHGSALVRATDGAPLPRGSITILRALRPHDGHEEVSGGARRRTCLSQYSGELTAAAAESDWQEGRRCKALGLGLARPPR